MVPFRFEPHSKKEAPTPQTKGGGRARRREEEGRTVQSNEPMVSQKQKWVPKTTAEPTIQVPKPVKSESQTGQAGLAEDNTVGFVEDRTLSDMLKVALSVEILEDDDEELVDYEPSPEPI